MLYLFAGKDRRTSIRSVLERFSQNFGGQEIECEEWDICRGPDNDLLDEETQRSLASEDRVRRVLRRLYCRHHVLVGRGRLGQIGGGLGL